MQYRLLTLLRSNLYVACLIDTISVQYGLLTCCTDTYVQRHAQHMLYRSNLTLIWSVSELVYTTSGDAGIFLPGHLVFTRGTF